MELRTLKYFLAVVQEGSIGGVFHLAAGVKDQPGGGRIRGKDPAAVFLRDGHAVVGQQGGLRRSISMVIVTDIHAKQHPNRQQAERNSGKNPWFFCFMGAFYQR